MARWTRCRVSLTTPVIPRAAASVLAVLAAPASRSRRGARPLLHPAGRREICLARRLAERAQRQPLRLLHDEQRFHEAALPVRGLHELVVAVVVSQVAGQRLELDVALLRVEQPFHLRVRLAPDHALRDLHGLRALGLTDELDMLHAGDEVRVVLDVDQGLVDALARRIDERPVLELDEAVTVGGLLAREEILRTTPVHAAIAGREQHDEQDARSTRYVRHETPPVRRDRSCRLARTPASDAWSIPPAPRGVPARRRASRAGG